MALKAVGRKFFTLGTCVPCMRHNASKIKIVRLEMDENLLAYFKKEDFVFAHDPKKLCKSGDIVLIKELPEKISPTLTHQVMEVVYPLGNITDPITGKKVVASRYRDDIKARRLRYGDTESAFDYDAVPERGWLEDKRDFTHRESYIKYNVFENDDQPYAV